MANCNKCGTLLKIVPAGVSKTKKDAQGNPKPYDAFGVCEACGNRQFLTPKPQAKPVNASASPTSDVILKLDLVLKNQRTIIAMLSELEKADEPPEDSPSPDEISKDEIPDF